MLPFLAHILPLGCPRRRPPLRHQARPSGRSLREKLETVDSLKARGGIHLVSLEERLYTFSTAGELVFYLLGAIAHFKRRLISERTCDGIAAARRPGRTPGRPPFDQETILATQRRSSSKPAFAARWLQATPSLPHAPVARNTAILLPDDNGLWHDHRFEGR